MNNIPICLITDENYIMPTMVLLQSMLDNKNNDSNYCITILSDNINQKSVKLLQNYSTNKFSVNVIVVDNPYKNLHNINKYVTNAAFLKFDIPFIMTEYDKILYLDVDMLVLDDLSNLYNTDIGNSYCAVVQDLLMTVLDKRNYDLGLNRYFNSGMLLLNTKRIREENLNKKMVELYVERGSEFLCHDQDVLNIIFNEDVIFVSPYYNWLISNSDFRKKYLYSTYKMINNKFKKRNIIIVHYVRLKPWMHKNIRFANLWTKYYKRTTFGNEILKLKSCFGLRLYFFLRGFFLLSNLDTFIKRIKKIFKNK